MNEKYDENQGYLQGRNNNKYTKTTEDKQGQNITDRQTNDRYKQE